MYQLRSIHSTPQLRFALPHFHPTAQKLRCYCTVVSHESKFILTWNAVMPQWLVPENNRYIGTKTQLRCSMNGHLYHKQLKVLEWYITHVNSQIWINLHEALWYTFYHMNPNQLDILWAILEDAYYWMLFSCFKFGLQFLKLVYNFYKLTNHYYLVLAYNGTLVIWQ